MLKVGLVLAGCGYLDGAEIQEAVSALIALNRHPVKVVPIAPDGDQHHVVNHQTGKETTEKRNVLAESARISRGNVVPLDQVNANDLDALVFAGGFGVAKNLCSFAFKGTDCDVLPACEALIWAMYRAKKPIGAICIAPALVAKVLGKEHAVELTIGTDKGTAGAIEAMGCKHVDCDVISCHTDETHRVVSTPAYMLAENAAEAFEGIRELVDEVVRLAEA